MDYYRLYLFIVTVFCLILIVPFIILRKLGIVTDQLDTPLISLISIIGITFILTSRCVQLWAEKRRLQQANDVIVVEEQANDVIIRYVPTDLILPCAVMSLVKPPTPPPTYEEPPSYDSLTFI